MTVLGNFNARTEREGGRINWNEGEEEKKGRRSKDDKINRKERRLVEYIEKRWVIVNGGIKGDE